MAALKMSGRIYNAMMKFAGGTKSAPQLTNMFFDNGKIYATDSYTICRWTPADKYDVIDNHTGEKIEKFFFSPRADKVAAGAVIYIDSVGLDIDRNSATIKNPDQLFEDEFKHSIDDVVGGIKPDFLAAIAALGKAVRTDKCGSNGIVDLDWSHNVLRAHINAGDNGYFDVIVMPVRKAQN